MCEFAGIAFLAEAALVMFTNQVVDAAALRGRSVMSVMAEDTSRAVSCFVFGAYRPGDF